MMSLCKSENVGCETITLPILKLQGGAKTCLELINLKRQTERKFTDLEQEWLQRVAKEFLHAVETKAELKSLRNLGEIC